MKTSHSMVTFDDLNRDWFEDPELADEISETCLQLFQQTQQSFDSVRSQRWYRRLWSTLTGGNTRELARGLSSFAEAQQFLLQLLEAHSQANEKSNVLMQQLAQGLKQLHYQQNQIARSIVDMAERVSLLEKEVGLIRHEIRYDPLDERTWNSEQKLLLWKVIILAMNSHTELTPLQSELLQLKSEHLNLEGSYLEEARHFQYDENGSVATDLQRLESYQMRRTIFRYAVGVIYASCIELTRSQRNFLVKLISYLHIKEQDEISTRNVLSSISASLTALDVDELISEGRMKSKSIGSAEIQSAYRQVDEQRARSRRETQKYHARVEQACSEIQRIKEAWSSEYARAMVYKMFGHVYEALEKAQSLPEDSTIDESFNTFNAEVIYATTLTSYEELPDLVLYLLNEVWDTDGVFSPATQKGFKQFHEQVGSVGGQWTTALKLVNAAELRARDNMPSTWIEGLKGAGLGAAGGALLGPIGAVGAVGLAFWQGLSKSDRFNAACAEWVEAVGDFIVDTDKYGDFVGQVALDFFELTVDELLIELTNRRDPEKAEAALREMQQILHENQLK